MLSRIHSIKSFKKFAFEFEYLLSRTLTTVCQLIKRTCQKWRQIKRFLTAAADRSNFLLSTFYLFKTFYRERRDSVVPVPGRFRYREESTTHRELNLIISLRKWEKIHQVVVNYG